MCSLVPALACCISPYFAIAALDAGASVAPSRRSSLAISPSTSLPASPEQRSSSPSLADELDLTSVLARVGSIAPSGAPTLTRELPFGF